MSRDNATLQERKWRIMASAGKGELTLLMQPADRLEGEGQKRLAKKGTEVINIAKKMHKRNM